MKNKTLKSPEELPVRIPVLLHYIWIQIQVTQQKMEMDPYAILEHVQRMARDPNAASSYLPTYQDYIKEFPHQNNYA